jgi:hypothetical protein
VTATAATTAAAAQQQQQQQQQRQQQRSSLMSPQFTDVSITSCGFSRPMESSNRDSTISSESIATFVMPCDAAPETPPRTPFRCS